MENDITRLVEALQCQVDQGWALIRESSSSEAASVPTSDVGESEGQCSSSGEDRSRALSVAHASGETIVEVEGEFLMSWDADSAW